MQRTKSSNASIDNLAKNLINKCNNIQRLDSINTKIMSSMNEQEYEANYNGNANNAMNILNTNGQSGNKSNLGSPSSPSSLSSSSSTSSTSSISSNQATAAAVQAAVQALLQQNNTSNQSLLTSTAAVNNAKSLLTPKELAKLNLDVKNFNLKDSSLLMQQQQLNNLLGAAASPNSQSNLLNLQQQLLMQSQNLDQNAMMNLLNNQMNEKNRQKGQTKPRGGNTPKQRRSKMEQNFEDSIEALMATAAANATTGLNINLINKHNQRNNTMRRNEIKGNSMSPSPPGTTCSDETETQNSGSPLSKNELYCASISSASGSSVDENHRRRLNKNRKNAEDIIENDCDEHDDLASSPRSLTQNDNDLMSSQTHNDYDSSILNENGDDNHMNSHYDDMDNDDYDDDDHLDDDDENSYDNNSSINNKKLHKKDARRNRNNSTSSPTRSSSSTPQSRSISPSNSYHDSPAAFPNLAAVAAANGIDSTTAMLAAQSLLQQQQTSGLSFPNAGSANTSGSQSNQGSSRKRRNDRESMSERNKKIKPVPDDKKDDAYWERRRKNNEAAKRSRDLRRQKEDEIAVRASFLESENLKLKAQVTILKAELSKLHFMLYNR